MARVRIGPTPPDQRSVEAEIARLRTLDLEGLWACWASQFRQKPPPHLPKYLLFRVLAYRLQADLLGDLDRDIVRLLDRSLSKQAAAGKASDANRHQAPLKPGTVLGREWKGSMQRVAVLTNGFAWNGKTYPSLSQVAVAITGTRWNGPKFFGLRDRPSRGAA